MFAAWGGEGVGCEEREGGEGCEREDLPRCMVLDLSEGAGGAGGGGEEG